MKNNKCVKGYNVQVLKSNAGYYIGTLDEENFPNCRLSVEYYDNEKKALDALENRNFMQRESGEIIFCNGSYRKCLI